uniref:Sesquipedalian n=1 Tax=Buteo japonicus TaxID=224669 RepID=A0A8C0C0R9_9AVES
HLRNLLLWSSYLQKGHPRWFLLCGGILSYYDSQEDAWKGCKGSIQMAVCEIQVHPADNTRMDLIIPGEQYFYLKARNAVERQKWLVALGTAKACLTDSRTQKEKEFTENTEALKTKMSELRLYCNLLVQQVFIFGVDHVCKVMSIKEIDMGALLKSTCDTFLKTLEECMQIANTAFTSELLHQTPPGSPHLPVLRTNKVMASILFSQSCISGKQQFKVYVGRQIRHCIWEVRLPHHTWYLASRFFCFLIIFFLSKENIIAKKTHCLVSFPHAVWCLTWHLLASF